MDELTLPEPGLPAVIQPDVRRGFLVDHWLGRYPLGRSFWLHYLLAPYVLFLILLACVLMTASVAQSAVLLTLMAVVLAQLGAWVWALIGTWRAADRHVDRPGASLRRKAVKVFLVANIVIVALAPLTGMLMLLVKVLDGSAGHHYG